MQNTPDWTGPARPRRHSQQGLSLLEALTGLAATAFVMAVAMTQLTGQLRGARQLLAQAQLTHELRLAMHHMARQVRAASGITPVPHTGTTGTVTPVAVFPRRIEFGLVHIDPAGAVSRDTFGFRLGAGAVQARLGALGTWQNLTDADTLEITELRFQLHEDADAADMLCGGGCPATAGECSAHHVSRWVQVVLAGRHRSSPGQTRQLEQSIRLRNDTLEAPCSERF